MRFITATLLLLGLIGSPGCGGPLHSQTAPRKWSTGFWYWRGGIPRSQLAPEPVDLLYFEVGEISHEGRRPWTVWAFLPDNLPPAREYWMVFRFNRQEVPAQEAAPLLAARASELRALAKQRQWNVVGVQSDIDSPTARLADYAKFLHEVKRDLPPGMELSITALVDWFRNGTDISEVVKEVDEFTPQFYDLANPQNLSFTKHAVSAKFDAAEWGPIFNRLGKRFRIGLSSFGRAERAEGSSQPYFYPDLSPLDLALNPAFQRSTSRNDANELVLTYPAGRITRLGFTDFRPGDGIQFILPTADTIRSAVASAKQIGGNCAGVIFFRWPMENEALVMQPEEVLAAAGVAPLPQKAPASLRVIDEGCATVKCVDLDLLLADPLRSTPARYRIHSSTPLEYFLPEKGLPVRMSGASDLELSLPPYGGSRRMPLGRAVSLNHADFSVREIQ